MADSPLLRHEALDALRLAHEALTHSLPKAPQWLDPSAEARARHDNALVAVAAAIKRLEPFCSPPPPEQVSSKPPGEPSMPKDRQALVRSLWADHMASWGGVDIYNAVVNKRARHEEYRLFAIGVNALADRSAPSARALTIEAPLEATIEMQRAAHKYVAICTPDGTWALSRDQAAHAYRVMMAAWLEHAGKAAPPAAMPQG